MKIAFFFFILPHTLLFANDFQQQADYKIVASYNNEDKIVQGKIVLTYSNKSDDVLENIKFHLWANAFSSKNNAYSKQLQRMGETLYLLSDSDKSGGYSSIQFAQGGKVLNHTFDKNFNKQVVSVALASPLVSGASVNIEIEFELVVPYLFSRLGFAENDFLSLTQWFPKVVVYDKKGWHPMEYLELGEYFSNFGNYDVTFELPGNYVVGATGDLINGQREASDQPRKVVQFVAKNVIDFALFASPHFLLKRDEIQIEEKNISLFNYILEDEDKGGVWKNSMDFTKRAVTFYSENIGAYPYNQVSVVHGPVVAGSGMEYPMITIVQAFSEKSLDIVIAHEVGHNWFQAILATNEREYPWMDEGLNSYYEWKYEQENYPDFNKNFEYLIYATDRSRNALPPIYSSTVDWNPYQYIANSYNNFPIVLTKLEEKMGSEEFAMRMQSFFEQWKFKHPKPEDFQKSMEDGCNACLDWFFVDYLQKVNREEYFQFEKKDQSSSFSFFKLTKQENPKKLFWLPIAGGNTSDGFMGGLGITNFGIPLPKIEFGVYPMYGVKSKTLAGMGYVNYNFYPTHSGKLQLLQVGLEVKRFSTNFNEIANYSLQYNRIKPQLSLVFDANESQDWHKEVYFSVPIIFNDVANFEQGNFVRKSVLNAFLPTIEYTSTNKNKVHPSRITVGARYHRYQSFGKNESNARLYFEYSSKYQYAQKKYFHLRLYAGVNVHHSQKNIISFSSGDLGLFAQSYHDVAREGFYFDRANASDNLLSRQIAIREGGFKNALGPEYASVFGNSKQAIFSSNIAVDLPFLPSSVPLKPYVDIGYFYTRNKKESDIYKNFQFSGGMMFSILDNNIALYLPLFSSEDINRVYKEQTKFLTRLTFSMDLDKLKVSKYLRSNSNLITFPWF